MKITLNSRLSCSMMRMVEKLASCQPCPFHELEGEEVQVGVHEENAKNAEWPLLIGTFQENSVKLHFVLVGSAQIPEKEAFLE